MIKFLENLQISCLNVPEAAVGTSCDGQRQHSEADPATVSVARTRSGCQKLAVAEKSSRGAGMNSTVTLIQSLEE